MQALSLYALERVKVGDEKSARETLQVRWGGGPAADVVEHGGS